MSAKPPSEPRRFRDAVAETPGVATAYQPGIQALEGADRRRLLHAQTATGSLALDEALKRSPQHAQAARWDYGIGLPGPAGDQVLWLEVHPASSGEADAVLKKLTWLRAWLRSEAPALGRLPARFYWLLTNVERNPNDRRSRNRLAEKHGLHRHQGLLDLAALSR